MQFINDGGLANTRISGNEHQLRSATLDDAVERGEQSLNFALSSVKFFRNQEPVWRVMFTEREFADTLLAVPFSKAAPKIALQATRSLIALLGSLREQLRDDSRYGVRNIFSPLGKRQRLFGYVAMYPLDWFRR